METIAKVQEILSELLDVDEEQVQPETYLVRDLDAESIDLLEAGLEVSSAFNIEIKDDDIFLRDLRLFIEQAQQEQLDLPEFLSLKLPHMSMERLREIIDDLEPGPVLKVKDLIAYIEYVLRN